MGDKGFIVAKKRFLKFNKVVVSSNQRYQKCFGKIRSLDFQNLSLKAKEDPDNFEKYMNGLINLTKSRTVPQIFLCGK